MCAIKNRLQRVCDYLLKLIDNESISLLHNVPLARRVKQNILRVFRSVQVLSLGIIFVFLFRGHVIPNNIRPISSMACTSGSGVADAILLFSMLSDVTTDSPEDDPLF